MDVEVRGEWDPDLAWDGANLVGPDLYESTARLPSHLAGAAAGVHGDARRGWRMLRDPLGINKLFWAWKGPGRIVAAARPHRLVEAGVPFEVIHAFPRGTVVDLSGRADESQVTRTWDAMSMPAEDQLERSSSRIAADIRRTLDAYVEAVCTRLSRRPVYVCLSGGLDSTGIALLVRDHAPDVVFVSFDLVGGGGRSSDDRTTARRIARDFGVALLEVDARFDELLDLLDVVLIEGIDWRPFNVHAALVNAALARAVREATAPAGTGRPLVFTGDLANEFLADYLPEAAGGVVQYGLPALPPADLRRILVQGLDTSHREVGVFGAWGLTVVQPYASSADLYLSLPAAFLEAPDRKQMLSRDIFGPMLPAYVMQRPKTRAQVGGAGGGVLGAFVAAGIDEAALRSRFAQLHATEVTSLGRFIRAGRYRSAVPMSSLEALHAH
jgi:asparagine synthetase B (glutamine-hydrolysing)